MNHPNRDAGGRNSYEKSSKLIGSRIKSIDNPGQVSLHSDRFWRRKAAGTLHADFENKLIFLNKGAFRPQALIDASNELIRRHPILCSTIESIEGRGILSFKSPIEFCVEHLQLTDPLGAERIDEVVTEQVWKPFSLTGSLLLRAFMVHVSDSELVFGLVVSHFITDGIALAILRDEFVALYKERAHDTAAALPPVDFQYWDYSSVLTVLPRDELLRHWQHWERILLAVPATAIVQSNIPYDDKVLATRLHTFTIGPTLFRQLKEFAGHQKTTLFAILLAAHNASYWQLTGQSEIGVAIACSGRDISQLTRIVGCLITTRYGRFCIDGEQRFSKVLEDTWDATLRLLCAQLLPLEFVAQELSMPGQQVPLPYFNFLPFVPNSLDGNGAIGENLTASRPPAKTKSSRLVTYRLSALELQNDVRCSLKCGNCLAPEFASQFISTFLRCLQSATEQANARVIDLF